MCKPRSLNAPGMRSLRLPPMLACCSLDQKAAISSGGHQSAAPGVKQKFRHGPPPVWTTRLGCCS
jgi:hypothetical protein